MWSSLPILRVPVDVKYRFARDCMQTVNDLTKKLEVTLGPDTGDLQIRVGCHSGPVTAGVVRFGGFCVFVRTSVRPAKSYHFLLFLAISCVARNPDSSCSVIQ